MAKKKRLTDGDYDFSIIMKEHVLSAIHEVDEKGVPPGAQSNIYDLIYKDKSYPPKLVLSWAYRYATGTEANRKLFNGGVNTGCFNCLEGLGFVIRLKKPKIKFQTVIDAFIKQADEQNSQRTDFYIKEYEGLKVKVSFGFGNYTRVPWISFLYEGQTTQQGIYPVFLYYKDKQLLILAYSVSEDYEPEINWDLPEEVQSVKDYFAAHDLGKPVRYGGCYVFRAYPLSEGFAHVDFDKDLKEIISYYKKIMESSKPVSVAPDTPSKPEFEPEDFDISRLTDIRQTGLLFSEDLLRRYAVSLLTKPFVILSGLSGSGKTRLALAFARWMAQDESQVKIVSVGADWNNREYLLGYPNALLEGTYVRPENGVLDFLLTAAKPENKDKPYFLILDEMNLSYVERYFADFLSAMESDEPITLHPAEGKWDVPAKVVLPKNLFLTGTINVDETTYMFSPKVLDRANVIEFRISREEMDDYLENCRPLQPGLVDRQGAAMGEDFIRIGRNTDLTYDKEFRQILLSFFEVLKKVGAEFGYRTAAEVYRFISISQLLQVVWDEDEEKNRDKLVDIVVMQKMLPKLHGSRKKLQQVLAALWELCKRKTDDKLLIEKEEVVFDDRFKYPLSAMKIWQMYKNAQDNGFTSYAEA